MAGLVRHASNVIAVAAAVFWSVAAAWHIRIIVLFGWPDFLEGQLFMIGPAIALAIHSLFFASPRVRHGNWGMGAGALSLILAMALVLIELSMGFAGYK